MFLKRLFKTLMKPQTIKIVSLLLIIGIFFIVPTFAAGSDGDALVRTKKMLSDILSLCSRLWIIFAILAGKLMTNDWVYGAILHMDIYLRKIWNIMKNFANFALIGIVLWNIISNLIGKKGMDLKDIITKTLIAGILIQASRFILGALVDLSTIATAAVGSFPSTFLQGDANLKNHIQTSLSKTPKKYKITADSLKTIENTSNETVDTSSRNEILPTYNSVSGPLIYLGFSVFKFQNYLDVAGTDTVGEITIAFLLRLVLILMYTLGLALLFLANIIRVAFLRIFVIGSPLIVLAMIFKGKDKSIGGDQNNKGIMQYLNFSVMIDLIFKPVIFVAGFAFIIIFVASIQRIMTGELPKSFNDVHISVENNSSTMTIENLSTIEVSESGILGNESITQGIQDVGTSIFVNLIIFFFTMFLMWQFIKIAVTSGKGPISNVMKPVTKFIEDTVKTLPIIPLGGGASFVGAQQFLTSQRKNMLEGMGVSTKGEFGNRESGSFETNDTKFRTFLNSKMGFGEPWMNKDKSVLNKLAKDTSSDSGVEFFKKTNELAKVKDGGISMNDTRWMENVVQILGNQGKVDNINKTLSSHKFSGKLEGTTDEKSLQTFFDVNDNAEAFYDLMGGSSATSATKPTNYESLKNITFHNTSGTSK